MKKAMMMAMAALMLVACGDAKNKSKEQTEGEEVQQEGTPSKTAGGQWTTYTNDKYGFSVEVPKGLIQKGEALGDYGTVYSADPEGGLVINRIDIGGGNQIFDEDFTPEKVLEDFKTWTDSIEVVSKECNDYDFYYVVKDNEYTNLHKTVYQGSKKVYITICYDADHEAQLGGDVAEHVFKSIKFK